eukprot:TRINITY_DN9613_c0_g1_i1.p1 TRINITY_DN9613_c0_g1~~TRINITY_DN9613_c0_g1_i1.p1  ORF type:complete len:208 (-),score=17.56 TRINITY_DN9613_c0_g1_i1:171-794(-)
MFDTSQPQWVLAERQGTGSTPRTSFSRCSLSLMKAYYCSGRLNEAVLVIVRMRAAGVQPDFGTWKGIIHAADALGDVKKADELYTDALSSETINPYKPWRSNIIRLASGRMPTEGCIMDLHKLNPATGKAALRHELQLRQDCAARRQAPLYIITGQGDGQLYQAVCETLRSHSIRPLYPKGERGVIVVPPTKLGVTSPKPPAPASPI